MRYWITIGILVLIMLNEYRRYKYVLTSTVLWPVMWIFALFALTQEDYFIVSYTTLGIIVVGYIIFCFGFHLKCSSFNLREATQSIEYDIEKNNGSLDILFWISILVALVYLVLMRGQFSLIHFLDSFRQLYRADINISSGLKYISFIPKCTMWYIAAVYAISRNKKSPQSNRLMIRLVALVVLNLIILVPGFVRTDFLFTYVPVVLNIVIITGAKDKTIMTIFGIMMAGFVAVFVSFSMLKHSYRYVGGVNLRTSALDELYEYLGGGTVAFDRLREQGELSWIAFNGAGKYTFNGLLGLIDRLFGTSLSPNTIQEFIVINGRSTRTNVYTIFKWTGMDFGIIYSIMLQFLYGIVHGSLFKGIRNGRLMSVYWYSAVMYGLLMMFFSDQYFSVGAMWIVTLVATVIVKYIANLKVRFTLGGKNMI